MQHTVVVLIMLNCCTWTEPRNKPTQILYKQWNIGSATFTKHYIVAFLALKCARSGGCLWMFALFKLCLTHKTWNVKLSAQVRRTRWLLLSFKTEQKLLGTSAHNDLISTHGAQMLKFSKCTHKAISSRTTSLSFEKVKQFRIFATLVVGMATIFWR